MQVSDLLAGRPTQLRSTHWPTVRDKFLKLHPSCAVCGYDKFLNIHHILPFHVSPLTELDETNLITLGEKCPTGNHHLLFGHLGDWKCWNPEVVADTQHMFQKISGRQR
jgi:5-methylcytosine-specific restriction protein A